MTGTATKVDPDQGIDEDLLVEAQRQLAAVSPNAAINEALRRLVEDKRDKRGQALERARQMSDDGLLDYSKLDAADQ